MNSKSPLWIRIAAPIGVLVAVAIAWHLAVDWFKLPPILLPKPARVLQAIWTERVRLVQGSWVTLQAAMLGLGASALIGSLVAILFSQSAWIRTALYPYVIFLQTRWQTLLKLRIPSAMRALVQGLRISCGLAVIGAIVGELFVGNSGTSDGLGSLMNAMQANLRTAELIGAILACTLLGILLFLGVELLNRWALRRWTIDTGFESAA